jgi:hypothetical protein
MSLVPLKEVGLWAMSVKVGPNKDCSVVFASQRKNEYEDGILAAQRSCKRKVRRKLMDVQTRPANLDINRTGAFHSQLSTHDLNDSSSSGEM